MRAHRRRGLGALALLALAGLVLLGSTFAFAGPGPVVREYWVAAVPVTWNVVPNGRNAIEGETFTPEQTTLRTIVYKRYTKGWARPLRDDPNVSGDNDGIPGPLLRARLIRLEKSRSQALADLQREMLDETARRGDMRIECQPEAEPELGVVLEK